MGKCILVVEDDDDIRALAELMLVDADYDVLTAASGEEGLHLLEEQSVDLAILDVMLPGIDGWEVCRRIRTNPRTATLPVMIFTVRSERLDREKVEQVLPDGYLNKPFDKKELLNTVQSLLEKCATTNDDRITTH